MTDDLVKRLRDVGRDYDFHENALVYSAADRIEALTAENERLREALGHIENYYGDGHRITELARSALEGKQ